MTEFRVVIADNQAADRELISRVIHHEKLRPELCYDGKAALKALQEKADDIILVITELKLPCLNGLELMRQVHQDLPQIPFIITTADGTRRDIIQALRQGAVDYFEKPYTIKDLSSSIRRIRNQAEHRSQVQNIYHHLQEKKLHFEIDNQIELVRPLVDGLSQEIKLCCQVSSDELPGIKMGLHELIVNAIEHGNLELTSELKHRHDYLEYLRKRSRESPYRERRVNIRLDLLPHQFTCIIEDQGKGFDCHQLPDPGNPDNLFKPHGRGIMMANSYFDIFIYNDAGNQVTVGKNFTSIKTTLPPT
jgi:CheY-like chemotaxis protein